jgi:hypothetical protein
VVRTDHARVFVGKVPQCPANESERMCADLEQVASGTVVNDTIRTAILKWVTTLDNRQIASTLAN